jgi:hypothetical protein
MALLLLSCVLAAAAAAAADISSAEASEGGEKLSVSTCQDDTWLVAVSLPPAVQDYACRNAAAAARSTT